MKTNHTYYKQIKQIISIAFILFFFNSNIYSQTMDLYDVEYKNIQIPHCNSIDLDLSTEHSITFKIHFEKAYYGGGTTADLAYIAGDVIMELGARGTTETLVTNHIDSGSWTVNNNVQYFELTGSISISNSQLDNNNGGGILSARYRSNNGTNFTSCDYEITRPEYSLSPSNSSISCGQSGASFTIEDRNNSIGNLVYHWNVGIGWLYNGSPASNFITTTNTITLVPYQYPPSDVHVTPVLDGVSYDELTSNVSLSGFNPSNTISGASSFCDTTNNSTFSVNGLPSGTYISSWTSSNTNIVTVNQINNHQAVITKIGIGSATITATIINSCGQQKTITKQVWTGGKPKITLLYGVDGANLMEVHLRGTGNFDINKQGITSTTWQKISNSGGCYANFSGYGFEGLAHGNCSNWIVHAKITATNSCGTTTIYRDITPPDPCDNYDSRLIVINNPMKEGANTNRLFVDDEPCDRNNNGVNNQTSNNYTILIYNKYGEKVYTKTQRNREFILDNLQKGFYIVKYQTKKGVILTKKLIIK